MERDIVDLLREDHARLEGLLTEVDQARAADEREPAGSHLVAVLGRHLEAERAVLYPVVQELLPDTVAESRRDHAELEHLLSRLDYMEPIFGGFEHTVRLLRQAVTKHVQEAEESILPRVLQDVPEARRRQLGAQFAQFSTTKLVSA